MAKVFLLVIIFYSDHPSMTYKASFKTTDDCYAQAAILANAPPVDENVTKFMIGCSFEEPLEHVPL